MQKIRVLVVDDHTIVRDGIIALLALVADIEVVGEAANGQEALQKATQLKPDVVLMDVAMPIIGGLEATRRLSQELPDARVLALTQHDDRQHIFSMLAAGARGFISKLAASSDLAAAIRATFRGDSFLSPSAARVVVEGYQLGPRAWKSDDPYEQLTTREREVLKLLAEGHTIREIAETLVISPKTVEGHKANLMSKLDIHRKTDLIKYAIRKGLVAA